MKKKELVCQAKDRSEKEKEDLGAKANYGEPIQRLWDITPVKIMENKQSIGDMQQESIDEQQGQSTSAIEQVRDVAYLF